MEMTPIGRVGSPRTEPLDDEVRQPAWSAELMAGYWRLA
jgi:hypothetical protein